MSDHRTITFPADAMQRIADRLMDLDPHLPGDAAMAEARDMVIDVTTAVDKLRASELAKPFPCTDCGSEYGMNADCDECLEYRRGD